MTDAEIEAYGRNLNEAFENAGRAVEDLMVSIDSVRRLETRTAQLEARDRGALLYKWIEALISFQDVDGLLFSRFSCTISKTAGGEYALLAKLIGEKFDPERHEQKTAIKAPTFHEMRIDETENRVTLRFLVDL
jgi:SHS2 domain-containing protein